MHRHTYIVHGLRVESTVPLPQLAKPPAEGPADVTITIGKLPRPRGVAVDSDGFVIHGSTVVLDVPGTGTFEARDGREIVVSPAPGAEPEVLGLFLLGSLMGAVLHQRGLLPIHASAVRTGGDSAVAFSADSGGGKSTLAGLLHQRGYPLICDDVGALETRPEGVFLHPGVPRVRLTEEAMAALGLAMQPPVEQHTVFDKREWSIEPEAGVGDRPARLERIYLLEYGEDNAVTIEPIESWEAFVELRRGIYRPALVRSLTKEVEFLRRSERLVSAMDTFRLRRPRDLKRLEEVLDPLEAHLADLSGRWEEQ